MRYARGRCRPDPSSRQGHPNCVLLCLAAAHWRSGRRGVRKISRRAPCQLHLEAVGGGTPVVSDPHPPTPTPHATARLGTHAVVQATARRRAGRIAAVVVPVHPPPPRSRPPHAPLVGRPLPPLPSPLPGGRRLIRQRRRWRSAATLETAAGTYARAGRRRPPRLTRLRRFAHRFEVPLLPLRTRLPLPPGHSPLIPPPPLSHRRHHHHHPLPHRRPRA